MINPTGKKLDKLLFGMFDDAIQGVDTYNHNGSMWLIFTDEMKWVVEYTKEQTLWYNYHLFKQEMEIIGLDCVENCDIIKKWFESRFLNINPVEDTIQNGVKDTQFRQIPMNYSIEDTIQNGVKETHERSQHHEFWVEDTIQNGVKHAYVVEGQRQLPVKDTIQNGVKETCKSESTKSISLRRAIQNGVKHCEDGDWLDGDKRFEDIIQNGEKK
jgi:hypothetical protein